MSATAAILAKKALDLAHDKRVRTLFASTVVGIAVAILLPLLTIVSIVNAEAGYSREIAKIVFDGGPIPSDASEELTDYMEEMMEAFDQIEITIEDMDTEGIDEIKVKSFFYVLYFTKDLSEFDEEFYDDYVDCFDGCEDEEAIYSALKEYLSMEFTDQQKEEIRSLYLYIRYGYTVTDKMISIPGEAFNDETFAQLMSEATKYIGFPYVWGGSSPETSFDCSGFVCWAYTHSGVHNLPRTSAQSIYNQCTPVPKDEVKPGDLVFFTGTYQSSNPVTHVGIYVGDNQMLHCGDPIGYANLGSSYWIKHFYAYGRL